MPWEIQEAEAPRFLESRLMKVVRYSVIRTCHLYPQSNIPGYSFLLRHAAGGTVVWGIALQTGRSRVRFLMMSLECFIDIILPSRTVTLGLTQSLTEMSTRNISLGGIKTAGAWAWQPYHLRVLIVLKSGNLILLEPSGPARSCNGITLPYCLLIPVRGCFDPRTSVQNYSDIR